MTAAIFRIASRGGRAAALVAPIAAYFLNAGPWAVGFCALLAALIYWRHAPNIARLLKGEEPRIGAKKKEA